jgi:hypothetical protein
VAKVKDKELKLDLEFDIENIENRKIIDADLTATVVTTIIQPEEPVDIEEGDHLFHS